VYVYVQTQGGDTEGNEGMEYAEKLQAYFWYWAPCPEASCTGYCEGRCAGGFGCKRNPTSDDCALWVAAWRRQVELAKQRSKNREERPGRECDSGSGTVFVVRWVGTEFCTWEALEEQVMLRRWPYLDRMRGKLVVEEGKPTTAIIVVQLYPAKGCERQEKWVLWHDEEEPASVDTATVVVEHRGSATDWKRVVKAEGL
jgi:hypothetical protein